MYHLILDCLSITIYTGAICKLPLVPYNKGYWSITTSKLSLYKQAEVLSSLYQQPIDKE